MKKLFLILLFVPVVFSCSKDDNSSPVYLDDNGVTIKCPDANVGDKGTVNEKEYTVVDEAKLRDMVSKDEDVTCVCTSKVTDMTGKDDGFGFITSSFNQEIGNWDTSNVTNMRRMFSGANIFNQDIGNWDTSKVTDMSWMFNQAFRFNKGIGNWDTSNVINMIGMFTYAISFNQNLKKWCVIKIISEQTGFGFYSKLTEVNEPVWGTCPND